MMDRDIGWAAHLGPDHASFDPSELTADRTLVASWRARWTTAPGRPVLHDQERGWVSGGELEALSSRVATVLADRGVAPGERVLLSGASTIDLVVVHIALLRLGAVVVPVNGAYRQREISHIAGDCRPCLAVSDQPAWRHWFKLTPVLSLADTVSAALDTPSTPVSLDRVAPGDPALIGYTSGTTGAPKGAVLSHANLLASVAALAIAWRWQADDRLVLSLPLFHAHGLCVGLHGTLHCGASAVLLDGFDPEAVLDAMHDHQATLFFGVPTMYARLLASDRAAELRALRLCVSGSAPLPASVHSEIAAKAYQRVLERYGMTETVMLVSNPFDGERRAGSVGLPLPGVELALDLEGQITPWANARDAGGVGEILVRGPNVFGGYWERPDANAAGFADGWFRTGDLGSVSPDGYVTVVGRAKELIISGGYNVYPREVEDVVAAHPAFAEVAVAGIPSSDWGEEVTVFAVLCRDAELPALSELRDWCRDALANYKLPRRVVAVEALPRNALGKVLKHQLVDLASTAS